MRTRIKTGQLVYKFNDNRLNRSIIKKQVIVKITYKEKISGNTVIKTENIL